MVQFHAPYVVVLTATALLIVILTGIVIRRPDRTGAQALSLLLLAILTWVVGDIGELVSTSAAAPVQFAQIQHLGIVAAPPAWLFFAARYTHSDRWLSWRYAIPLITFPLLTLLLVWSQPPHGLLWPTLALRAGAQAPVLERINSTWFWIHMAFAYGCLAVGSWLLIRAIVRDRRLVRWQAAMLLAGVALPWLASLLYLFRIRPFAPLDPAPLAFAGSAILLGWCTLRFHPRDIQPIAPGAIVNGIADPLLVVDRRDRIVELNAAAAHLFACPIEKALERPVADLLAAYPALVDAVKAGRSLTDEIVITNASAHSTYRVHLSQLSDRRGRPTGTLIHLHDVTALKAAELAAAAAARTRSEFLAHMSHEIRTPLNVIGGAVSVLLARTPGPEQGELLELIQSSSTRLLSRLSDVLDLALLESGTLELEPAPFDPRRTIALALDAVRPRAAEKQLALSVQIDSCTPDCLISDPERVRQILELVLDNAVKFTERGEITVTLSAQPLDDQRYELQFTVLDTGPGVEPEDSERLFQPFAQGDGAATRRHTGSGLGLAIAQRLCALLGGRIGIVNRYGQGSICYATLIAERPPGSVAFYLPDVAPQLRGKRALIVASSDEMRRTLTLQTRGWGLRPTAPPSSAEALELLRQGLPFDIAVVELEGPAAEALAFITALETTRQAAHIPVVALLAPNVPANTLRQVVRQVPTRLPGPFKPAQLHAVLVASLTPAPTAAQPDALATMRILLVEDDPTNRILTEHLIRILGHHVVSVDSGFAALDILEQELYDLVLLDVQMPDLDGLEVARTICRRRPRAERPPLVALTANAVLGDRERCLAAGMDDYLSKPVSLELLAQVIAHYQRFPETATSVGAPATPVMQPAAALPGDPNCNGLSRQAYTSLIRSYLDDTSQALTEMQRAAAEGNGAALARIAHRIKSSSAIVGALELSRRCDTLEHQAPTADQATLQADVAAIVAEYERVRAMLQQQAEG
jgi:signal transduction histidine kinase/CheY-like chemotaxis protein/HPt (histidine-containing phosphotransfer) domain-containing protein